MAHPPLEAFLSAASACAHSMLESATYIEDELPKLALPEPFQGRISAVCSVLVGTKHDIVTEVGELYELMGLGEPPESSTVQRRVERIVRWLGDDMPKLHAVVKGLEEAVATQGVIGSAYILVAESAVNVYRSFAEVSDAAARYRAALGPGAVA